MKIYDSLKKAFEDKDFDGLMKFYHSDYSFIRHQTNTTMSLSEWFPMMKSMLESNKFEMISWKCIYENDDILFSNYVIFYAGTKLNPHKDPNILRHPYKRIQIPIIIPEVGKCTMKWINGDKIIWEEGVPQVCNVMYDVHEASNLSNKDMIMMFIDVKTDTIVEL